MPVRIGVVMTRISWFMSVVILVISLAGCVREQQVETVFQSTVTAHLTVNLLSGEKIDLGTETVPVEIHKIQTVRNGVVISEDGCHLSFPGQDGNWSTDLSVISLNGKALELERRANAVLDEMGGGPFVFTHHPATLGTCNEADIYANITLLVSVGDRNGPGFLNSSKNYGPETAFVYLPVVFYDHILKAVIEDKDPDWTDFTYPSINEVGGYMVLPGDPNGLKQWLEDQQPFLQKVYDNSSGLDLTFTLGQVDYTTYDEVEIETGYYECPNRKLFCMDRVPITKSYVREQTEKYDVEIGKIVLK